jgi:acetate CoA/acetoacetate CoA-transferase alpha subunit
MLEKPIITAQDAAEQIQDGMTLMIGGFMAVGTPTEIIDALVEKGVRDLTIIANDTGFADRGIGKLVSNRQVKKIIASHIGLNPETGKQISANELEAELVPQGTLIERIRAQGAGLGGVLTQTGLGTIVEEGKEKVVVDGKTYLLEKPLHADFSLIYCSLADRAGNALYYKTAKNFNPIMAMAADNVIVECAKVVCISDDDQFTTPGIFMDYLVIQGGAQ